MLPFPSVTSLSPLFREVRVTGIHQETSESRIFELAPEGWELHYQSGQFLTFVVPTASGLVRRSYSLCSAPGEVPAIAIKRVANGLFSRPMLESAAVGDRLTVAGGASGMFTLPDDATAADQLIFLAAGSGITPIFSMIKHVMQTDHDVSVLLAYSNRNPQSAMFREELEHLERRYTRRLKIIWLYSNDQDLFKARLSKTTLERLLDTDLVSNPSRVFAFLCGPFDYMRMAAIVLQARGIPADQIRREVFTPEAALPDITPPDTRRHEVTLRLQGRTYTLDVAYPDTILKAARKAGIELPFSCEAGRCGSCIAECTKGEVWMRYNEVLTDREVERGRVLVCQSFPVGGDVTIEYL